MLSKLGMYLTFVSGEKVCSQTWKDVTGHHTKNRDAISKYGASSPSMSQHYSRGKDTLKSDSDSLAQHLCSK